jgi:hypothetical protein
MQTIICSKCYKDKPITEFSTRKRFIKTLQDYRIRYNKVCKRCVAEQRKQWRVLHPTYMATYYKGSKEDPIKKICINCGNEFITNNPNQKTCAVNCIHKATESEFKVWRSHYPGVSIEVFKRMKRQKQT